MAEETRDQLKVRLTTGSVINQTALHNLLDTAILKTTDTSTQLTEGTNLFHTAARVRATDLEGLVSSTDEITAADSILSAIGKAKGLIAGLSAWSEDTVASTSVIIARNYSMHAGASNSALTGSFTINITAGTTKRGFRGKMIHAGATVPTIAAGTGVSLAFVNVLLSSYSTLEITTGVYETNVLEWEVVNIDGATHYVDVWCYQREAVINPQLLSATVEDAAPTQMVLVFSEAVDLTNFGFTLSGTTSGSPSGLAGSGTDTITLTLADAVANGETVLLNYNQGTGDAVSDATGQPLLGITNFPVANNVGAAGALIAGFTNRWYGADPLHTMHGTSTNALIEIHDAGSNPCPLRQGASTGAAAKPILVTDGDGYEAISFVADHAGANAAAMYNQLAERSANPDWNEATIFFVIDPMQVSAGRGDLMKLDWSSGLGDASNNRRFVSVPYSANAIAIFDGGAYKISGAILSSAGRQLITMRKSATGNVYEAWLGNTAVGSPNHTSTYTGHTPVQGNIEVGTGSGTLFDGRIYDIVVYESAMNDTDLDANRATLIANYDL